ncbi:MAG: hypothetical protein Kow0092_00840 [Deferrisomatales bacterium]
MEKIVRPSASSGPTRTDRRRQPNLGEEGLIGGLLVWGGVGGVEAAVEQRCKGETGKSTGDRKVGHRGNDRVTSLGDAAGRVRFLGQSIPDDSDRSPVAVLYAAVPLATSSANGAPVVRAPASETAPAPPFPG